MKQVLYMPEFTICEKGHHGYGTCFYVRESNPLVKHVVGVNDDRTLDTNRKKDGKKYDEHYDS